MRQLGDTKCPKCGGMYWRKSADWHKCVVVNKPIEPPIVVVNTPTEGSPLVVNRKADRHKKTDARKKYQIEWMRKSRAKGSSQAGKD